MSNYINRGWSPDSSRSHEEIPLYILPKLLIKAASSTLSVIIAQIANWSCTSGQFSAVWKAGIVTSLLKKPGSLGHKLNESIENSSSLQLAFSVEPAHCCVTKLLQSTYHAPHSTETAMVKVMDDILRIIDAGSTIVLVGLNIITDLAQWITTFYFANLNLTLK